MLDNAFVIGIRPVSSTVASSERPEKRGIDLSISGLALVGSVQYTCPVVSVCIVDTSLSHYVGN